MGKKSGFSYYFSSAEATDNNGKTALDAAKDCTSHHDASPWFLKKYEKVWKQETDKN
ncbi:MAG TPA: hypothetical protein VI959_01550 [Alphaproteobacteria bacterium]|nr:hypothetical protein [Alphaproteobacteria bacterium]